MAVKLAKEMYQQARQKGMTFSQLLEKERPSTVEGLDAFEFALFDQDINLNRDTVERFYRTKEDSVLFPLLIFLLTEYFPFLVLFRPCNLRSIFRRRPFCPRLVRISWKAFLRISGK